MKPKYASLGFRVKDLHKVLAQTFPNSAVIRYELNKMQAREVIKKQKGKSFYRVSGSGFAWLWASISSFSYLSNPLGSTALKNQYKKLCSNPTQIEEAYRNLNLGLSQMTEALAMVA